MPGLVQRNAHSSNLSFSGSVSASWIWNHRGDVTFDQLQMFWSELSPQARQELLRIDKQTLFEHARKNLYCSRCNGLLLEGFSQIVMYGKSLQQEGSQDEVQDPSVHPWGGLAATKDGILTLLDCFLGAKSLKALQNVFDSARARERERELLYPDACGGGGRGWISQGIANYGRGHGTRESCALHTARLSCDTLVDFWSALGDETQQSLLRIKEDDFIERLMYRFDSKRFCRDCRRNVVREFKKLKELKRMRREARCTNSFCVADTAFQYVVSEDTVQADWHQSFTDVLGSYHHFEWAIGTAEGKSNILEFEDVGLNGSVQVSGLDLAGLSSCFITLRAWKLDGRCIELSVKAHALKGQSCIHRRLIVGDGYVTITKGESIRRFFEHAEEAEEEEDDDSMDKDGNDPDGDGSRPQKHAKSPELAQEFLLDAATVIFKDQVEKAFREGTARQNAHSIFICLALKLLEERVHVACKEIITLQKQIKLLEEEEKEKRIEEERKERRKMKEREKKLRRKERLKGKDKECMEPKQLCCASDISGKESSLNAHEESRDTSNSGDSISETGENTLCSPLSSDTVDEKLSSGFEEEILGADSLEHYQYDVKWNFSAMDGHSSFKMERSKSSRRKLRFRNDVGDFQGSRWRDRKSPFMVDKGDFQVDKAGARSNGYVAISSRRANGMHRQSRKSPVKFDTRNCGAKFGENFHCSTNRVHDSYDLHSCSSNQHNNNYRSTDASVGRSGRVYKSGSKMDSVIDVSIRPVYRSITCNHDCYGPDTGGGHKSNISSGRIPQRRGEILHNNKVWGVRESEKSFCRSSLEFDATFRPSDVGDIGAEQSHENRQSIDKKYSSELLQNLDETDALNYQNEEVGEKKSCSYSSSELQNDCHKGFDLAKNSNYYLKNLDSQEAGSFPITSDPIGSSFSSSSDNCSSCLSEGDSSTGSSGAQNADSDSEDAGRQSEAKVILTCTKSPSETCLDVGANERDKTEGQESCTSGTSSCAKSIGVEDQPIKNQPKPDTVRVEVGNDSRQHDVSPMHSQCVQFPVFPVPSSMGYYHQTPASWATGPPNGLVQFPQQNCFLLAGPLTYGLSANQSSQFGLLYGATPQTLTAPVLKVSHLPWYQLPNKDNQLNSKEQTKSSELSDTREPTDVAAAVVSERHLDRPLRNGLLPQKASSPRKDGNHAKPQDGTSNFSLFHFGGPISASLKDESIGDFSSKQAGLQVHLACSKKETTIEEYSLFAATNTSRFSFF